MSGAGTGGAVDRWARRAWAVCTSQRSAVLLLLVLFLLTLLGTFHQVEHGLYAAQQMYFNSWLVWQPLPGPLVVPLPGGYLAMLLLTINLVCGGMIALPWHPRRAGILIVHAGILLLLLAGAVKFHQGHEGNLLLWEPTATQPGQQSGHYADNYLWEVVISAERDDRRIREYRIPQRQFSHLGGREWRRFSHPELPFALELSGYQRHCRPLPKGPMVDAPTPVVDGWFLMREEPRTNAEQNLPGLQARVVGASEQRGLLYGGTGAPWTVTADGARYGVVLRRVQYPMPFQVRLDDFQSEFHPGTRTARAFRSRVTVIDADGSEVAHLIEMNEPLRRDGLILFQASYGPQDARAGDRRFSVFAVVRNPADQWPLWACIVIAAGLVWHFGTMLLAFIRRRVAAQSATRAAVLLTALLLPTVAPAAEEAGAGHHDTYRSWPPAMVDLIRTVPVQDQGRIKPLSTAAAFTLLRLNGRRALRHDGAAIGPTAWALDVMLRPALAERQAVFQIQTSAVLDAIGIGHADKDKRDRYSYADLLPGRQDLLTQAARIEGMEADERGYREEQILALAHNLRTFERWRDGMECIRWRLDPTPSPVLRKFLGTDPVGALAVYRERAPLLYALDNITEIEDGELRAVERRHLERALGRAVAVLELEAEPAIMPPMHAEDETWLTTSDVLRQHLHGDGHDHDWSAHLGLLRAWQALYDQRHAPAQAQIAAARTVRARAVALAEARDEYRKIVSEDTYYRYDLLYRALILFVLGFVLTAVLWLRPTSRLLAGSVWWVNVAAVLLVIAAIAWRCYLRGRPPVSTLYETVLFITASIGLVALVIEAIVRNRVALSLTSLLGACGLFLAMRYETNEAVDTMPQLIAVLDTNFWLATHVTTVTLGYAAGVLAGAIAAVYLGGRLLGFRRNDDGFYRDVARLVYGVTCFSLIFSVVGTILGGIWANDSWGRFWGWDPKENGALLIVLAQLAILHARKAEMIRAYGLCLAAVATVAVVVFSWWHVNQLGTGLHSYGHTDGVMRGILIAYATVALILGLGLLARWRDGRRVRRAA